MEKKKISCSYSVLVILLFAVVCILTDYIVIDRKLNEGGGSVSSSVNTNTNDDAKDNTGVDGNQDVKEDRTLVQSELDKIAREELYIFGGKKSISELNDDDKLWFSFKKFFSFSDDNFKGSDLKDYYNSTSLGNLDFVNGDIPYYLSDCIIYHYDSVSDTYNKTNNCNRGASWVDYAYVDVSDYTVDGDNYTIDVKYLWYYNEPANAFYLYGKYSDVYELSDGAGIYNDKCLNSSPVIIHDNDSELKSILDNSNVETYTFTFEKTSDGFKVVNLDVK